ncbi:methyl-accepting chemotaxis protein [Vibrio sp. JC009]|uniref:methyl-accepting chemotaxis protein n=1 Tax=Vibrio sp. JC009 TaxID=2912314 RepID=UPI0023AF0D95|nr:methyl-accepting chemotaxis protein [Vibrio sp. JC009]WED23138.1 methyl-accepting chemotaxis protein [Vibrio sp. JC009]
MTTVNKSRFSLSLIQTLVAIFVAIILSVIGLAVVSKKGVDNIGVEFETLSEHALPLAMDNAKLTQNVLQKVKVLNQGLQSKSIDTLKSTETSIQTLTEESDKIIAELFAIADDFDQAISTEEKALLNQNMDQLQRLSRSVIQAQYKSIELNAKMDEMVPTFRYGLSSIGPEMSRIASFLVQDNPEASDAANRFISQSSELESTFLVLLMQNDLDKAKVQYREMKNRKAGIELAFDDFAQWHPDVNEFASLIAPYEMVKEGFADTGVLKVVLSRLEVIGQQEELLQQATEAANQTIATLNSISEKAESLISDSRAVVNKSMASIIMTVIACSLFLGVFVLISGIYLNHWINKGLKSITRQLSRLTEHDFSGQVKVRGPYELQVIGTKLNQVIDSTNLSLKTVTENCETLYATAGDSHLAAEQTDKLLLEQNDSLSEMVTAIEQLQASINEISKVTSESYTESQSATEYSEKGTQVLQENTHRLESLDRTLTVNEGAMNELDHKVSSISEMVDVISGIAESTNLLALNAAIEAARAGEQGRGFAVVADEVRKLASGTSEQTEKIREMMAELIKAAESSKASVEESRQEMASAMSSNQQVMTSFTDIEQAVNHIRLRVEQISVATEQQERATANVQESIAHINRQGEQTKHQLGSMIKSSENVANIAGEQQAMLHKYEF